MELDHKTISRCSTNKGGSSKTRLFKTNGGKCHRPGPVLRNPYLNFLREFRRRNCGLSAVEVIRRGAKEWKTMPKETKLQYIEEAFYAPKRRKPPNPFLVDVSCCPKILCPGQKKKKKQRKKSKSRKCGQRRKAKKRRSKPKRKGGCKPKRKKKPKRKC